MSNIKRASWLELFYDLVFVAIIAQLTYAVAEHHSSVLDFVHIIFVSYAIFYAWAGVVINRNLQEIENHFDKVMIQVQMVLAFFLSLTLPEVFDGNIGPFALSYALIRFIQIGMLIRGYRLDPENAPRTWNIAQGMIIAALLMITITFVPYPYVYSIALMWLLLEIFNVIATGKGNKIRYLNVHHLQERLGLFLLLIMGESVFVVAIANTIADSELTTPSIIFSSLITIIAFWWTYFSHLEACGEGKRPTNLLLYMHSHVGMFISIVFIAAGYKNMLKHHYLVGTDLFLLVTGISVFALTSYIIRGLLRPDGKKPTGVMLLVMITAMLVAYLMYQFADINSTVITLAIVVSLWAIVDEKRRVFVKNSKFYQ